MNEIYATQLSLNEGGCHYGKHTDLLSLFCLIILAP